MNSSLGNRSTGKILYGVLFVVIVPIWLVAWARITEGFVQLPVPGSLSIGVIVASMGITLILSGMAALMIYGNGLPMNAYPPLHYVHRGIYRLFPHPIYTGFSILCIGLSMAFRSPSGLWLVSPVVILACVGIVQGYERHDLTQRFGSSVKKPLIALPANGSERPEIAERISVFILVLLPWLMIYEAFVALGAFPDAVVGYLPFEKSLPVYEWTEIIYGSTYLFVLAVPFVAPSSHDLRRFATSGLAATGLIAVMFFVIPVTSPAREFVPQGFPGKLLLWERGMDTPAAAFPSFHVVWAILAATAWSKAIPSLKSLWWLWACLISISCMATGMHALVDVLAGAVVGYLVLRIEQLWIAVRSFSERIANSWHEWYIGPVRIINHGIYGGAASFFGLVIVGSLLGPGAIVAAVIVAFTGLVMAALWAQFIEGSPSLLRPYGFYGGLLGVILGSLIAGLVSNDTWLLLGAFSVAAPWIQATGRLRCLVQGCCHGRAAPETVGIRYSHPRSRVCRLAGLANVSIHPTPLYSILWNILTGVILARLWSLHAPATLIAGIYLIFNGIGRFVEESYRGEPQTPILGTLRLYQLLAILSVVAGTIVTTIGAPAAVPGPGFNWLSLPVAAGFALITWFALGVDFPNSNKRFARLV